MRKFLATVVVAFPISLGFGVGANAQEVIFSAVGPTTQDYQMGVAWSNLMAESGSDIKLTVVDNGSVKGLRQVAAALKRKAGVYG